MKRNTKPCGKCFLDGPANLAQLAAPLHLPSWRLVCFRRREATLGLTVSGVERWLDVLVVLGAECTGSTAKSIVRHILHLHAGRVLSNLPRGLCLRTVGDVGYIKIEAIHRPGCTCLYSSISCAVWFIQSIGEALNLQDDV